MRNNLEQTRFFHKDTTAYDKKKGFYSYISLKTFYYTNENRNAFIETPYSSQLSPLISITHILEC